jgi:hypothetical protein
MQTGDRRTAPRNIRDVTGRAYAAAQANAAANREVRLAMGQDPAGYVERARSESWRDGYSKGYDKGSSAGLASGWRDGWNELAQELIDHGLVTAEQVISIANGEDILAADPADADPAPVEAL